VMIISVTTAYVLTATFFLLIYLALEHNSGTFELISYVFLVMAFVVMSFVTVMNLFSKNKVSSLSYSEMVTSAIDEYFKKININFVKDGIEFAVIEGHFWIEVRILEKMKDF